MTQISRLNVYAVIYLCMCLFANVSLMIIFFLGRDWNSNTKHPVGNDYLTQEPDAEDWDPEYGKELRCDDIADIKNLTIIGSGWTKTVYSGVYKNVKVAVKTIHTSGHDMANCQEEVKICYQHCVSKMKKEISFLQQLSHANVVRVLGECIPNIDYSPGPPPDGIVFMVTELGHQVDMIKILKMDFEERLKLAYDVATLLKYLADSPLGPLLMKDFRRQQFVLVGRTLKLSDVDDLIIGDPKCSSHDDCVLQVNNEETRKKQVKCEVGVCRGHNSFSNAIQAGHHFMKILIPHGSPKALESIAQNIVDRQINGDLDSESLHLAVKHLIDNYSEGLYIGDTEKDAIKGFDTHPGQTVREANFVCQNTASWGCVFSVSSAAEGAWLCSLIPRCQAFVLINQWTWTGRQIAVLKSAPEGRSKNEQHTLYIRRGQG